MRIFIAVDLDGRIKEKMHDMQNRLKDIAEKGNFTGPDNLHITVAFIGEVSYEEFCHAADALDFIDTKPFVLRISGFGRFRRSGGDIYWMDASDCPELVRLHEDVAGALKYRGISIDERPFRPHITLARQIRGDFGRAAEDAEKQGPLTQDVKEIKIMESTRAGGKLAYPALFTKVLT